ncbi:MAG: hypothetical protein WCK75_05375 [Elusimicrobiota bacterium]
MKKTKIPILKIFRFFILIALPAALAPLPRLYAQIKVIPVANISLMGGKYYLDDKAASFQGRADAFISSDIKFSESSELIPVYSGYYNGTQDIQELAGGGVLTRKRQGHTFSLKYVNTREFDKYKPRVSYSKNLISETKDEKWGDGLFDYATFSAGFEAEQERPYGTFTESYDYYSVKYGNYATLLSKSQTVIDTATFNELSANAGANTMDNVNHRLGFAYTWFPDPLVLQAGCDFTWRGYGDQAVVARPVAGSPFFKADKRSDLVQNITFKLTRNIKPLMLSVGSRVSYLSSNQNSYDASRTKFIEDYYSYVEFGVSPSMNFGFKNGAMFGFSVDYSKLYYLGRLKQDDAGNYSKTKANQDTWLTSLSVRYPVMNRFFARAGYNYQIASSNTRYEANYKYNYRASNYLMGLEWEF